VFDAIRTNLCEDYDWYKETTIGDTPLQAPQALKNLRPDGIFVNTINRQWTLVDYTRGSGWDRAALQQSETRKQNHYAQLVTELRKHHASVELFPLASTYNGAIAEETWRALMTRLELSPQTQNQVLHIAIKHICIAFSDMVDIRHSALSNTRQHQLDHPDVDTT
jgi:hypothetical protein